MLNIEVSTRVRKVYRHSVLHIAQFSWNLSFKMHGRWVMAYAYPNSPENITLCSMQARLLPFYEFRKHSNASGVAKNTCDGPFKRFRRHGRSIFRHFKTSDFDLSDKSQSRRPVPENDERPLELVEKNCRRCKLAEELQCHRDSDTTAAHLHYLGKAWRYVAWTPHGLSVSLTKHFSSSRLSCNVYRKHLSIVWLTFSTC